MGTNEYHQGERKEGESMQVGKERAAEYVERWILREG